MAGAIRLITGTRGRYDNYQARRYEQDTINPWVHAGVPAHLLANHMKIPKLRKNLTAIQRKAAELKRAKTAARAKTRKRRGRNKITVDAKRDPQYPGIYKDPVDIVEEAAANIAPESPNLMSVFGVSRADMEKASRDLAPSFEHQDPL